MNDPLNSKEESYARRMFRESLRRYFAPLTGALRAIKAEMIRSERERKRSRE